MTAETETLSAYIREKIDEILAATGGLTKGQLNRALDLTGANSPFVIATHTFGNLRSFTLGIACGRDLSRDRPSEFRARGTYEELAAAGRNLSHEIEAALREINPATLCDSLVPAQELWGEGQPREITRRAALVHTLEHAGIHLGHLQVTVELLRQST
jgi:hypothetical protein